MQPANDPPVACDMTGAPDTPEERLAEYGRLFAQHLVGRERTADGIRFRFALAPEVQAWVRDLANREKECCPFFDFSVTVSGGEVWWDANVIDDDLARQLLQDFYRLPEALAAASEPPPA